MVLKRFILLFGTGSLMVGVLAGCASTYNQPKAPVKAATPLLSVQDDLVRQPDATQRLSAVHVTQGRIACFDAGTMNNEAEPLTCEPSAVLFENGQLIVASDKKTVGEGLSPVFIVGHEEDVPKKREKYVMSSALINARKIEDFSSSSDKKWSFATSAFDRFREDKAKWDAFNSFVYWRHGHPEEATLANVSTREGVPSSLELRDSLRNSMKTAEGNDVPYFKVEGLAALPGNRLIFGIRERGQSFRNFTYTVTLIEAVYRVIDGQIKINPLMRELYRFQPSEIQDVPPETGLSSLYYDLKKERLYLLTSYEKDESPSGLGAYLWTLSLQALYDGSEPYLVTALETNEPLLFPHKGEALTLIGENLLLVFHDDDRVIRTAEQSREREGAHARLINEGVWSLIELK